MEYSRRGTACPAPTEAAVSLNSSNMTSNISK